MHFSIPCNLKYYLGDQQERTGPVQHRQCEGWRSLDCEANTCGEEHNMETRHWSASFGGTYRRNYTYWHYIFAV
jgi:hypothetical protein